MAEVDAIVQRVATDNLMADPKGVTLSEDKGEVVSHLKSAQDIGVNSTKLSKN